MNIGYVIGTEFETSVPISIDSDYSLNEFDESLFSIPTINMNSNEWNSCSYEGYSCFFESVYDRKKRIKNKKKERPKTKIAISKPPKISQEEQIELDKIKIEEEINNYDFSAEYNYIQKRLYIIDSIIYNKLYINLIDFATDTYLKILKFFRIKTSKEYNIGKSKEYKLKLYRDILDPMIILDALYNHFKNLDFSLYAIDSHIVNTKMIISLNNLDNYNGTIYTDYIPKQNERSNIENILGLKRYVATYNYSHEGIFYFFLVNNNILRKEIVISNNIEKGKLLVNQYKNMAKSEFETFIRLQNEMGLFYVDEEINEAYIRLMDEFEHDLLLSYPYISRFPSKVNSFICDHAIHFLIRGNYKSNSIKGKKLINVEIKNGYMYKEYSYAGINNCLCRLSSIPALYSEFKVATYPYNIIPKVDDSYNNLDKPLVVALNKTLYYSFVYGLIESVICDRNSKFRFIPANKYTDVDLYKSIDDIYIDFKVD